MQTFPARWAAPGRPSLRDARDGSELDGDELDLLLRRALGWWRARGARPGDRVLLAAPPELESLLLVHGAMLGGLCPVVLPPSSPPARVEELARGLEVVDRVAGDPRELGLAEAPEAAPVEVDPDAEALILLSSGSTGPAHAVRLSHRALWNGSCRVAELCPGRVHAVPLALHMLPGLRGALLLPLAAGGAALLLPPEAPAAELLQAAAGADVLHAGPGFVRAVNADPARHAALVPPGLRRVKVGGAPLTVEERRRFATTTGLALYHSYGLTETGGSVSVSVAWPDGRVEPGVGRPRVPIEIRAAGRVQPPGSPGRIFVAPDGAWIDTGDLGRIEAGVLHVQGREARQFVAGSGEKVLLDELDALFAGLGAVAATVPVQLPHRAPLIGAWVESPAEVEALRAALAARLPRHARPGLWRTGPLPRLPSGKVDLAGVRAAFEHPVPEGPPD